MNIVLKVILNRIFDASCNTSLKKAQWKMQKPFSEVTVASGLNSNTSKEITSPVGLV